MAQPPSIQATSASPPEVTNRSDGAPRREPTSARAAQLIAAAPRAPSRRRLWKRGALVLFALAVAALIGVGLRPRPISVESALATRSRMRVTVDEDGVARIQDRYVVSAPLGGRLERLELNPGDQVLQGATLARVMPTAAPLLDERTRREAEARLAMTQAAQGQSKVQVERAADRYQFAKEDAQRKHELEKSGSVPHELVDSADLALRMAASELESLRFGQQVANHEADMARAALGRLTGPKIKDQFAVLSPVDGKILRVIQKSEGVVAPGTPLLEIGDPNALEIAIDVLTSDAVRIKPSAIVMFERWGGDTLEGRVRRVEPSAFTRISALGVEEQRVNVIVDLTSPRAAWAALGDGYRVEARIVVWEADDVLQVPGSAVFRHGDGWGVFRVVDSIIKLSPIEIGERTPHSVAIVRGLENSDRVVLHPSGQVRDGVEVTLSEL